MAQSLALYAITTLKMREILRFCAWLCALCAGAVASAQASVTDYPFRLLTRPDGSQQELVAQNDGPALITVYVSVSGENFASDRSWPATVVVPPYTALPIGRIFATDKAAGAYSFLFRYSHHFGHIDAVHDANALYRLPFRDGEAYAITQAHGGKLTSHNNPENLYAVDFAMPRGSVVVAARPGVVIDVTLRHQDGGFDPSYLDKANTVAIVHDDGTVAEYAHLSPSAEIVKVGQHVAAGAVLGYSGNTGYSSGPHLHFIVSKPTVTDGKVTRTSVPVTFYANDPPVRFSAQAGITITADYRSAALAQEQTQSPAPGTATGLSQ
ncbi:MAG: M23 family metallopeptidase [Burkholderiales bacterium]